MFNANANANTVKKLLIVEDDKNISYIISENAKIEGYECDISYDGENGLSKASQILMI